MDKTVLDQLVVTTSDHSKRIAETSEKGAAVGCLKSP